MSLIALAIQVSECTKRNDADSERRSMSALFLFNFCSLKKKKRVTHSQWVFGSVVISLPKKSHPFYEGVGSLPEIFKIYVCEFILEFLS